MIGADCMYSDDPAVAMSLAAAMRKHLLPTAGETFAKRGYFFSQSRRSGRTQACQVGTCPRY